MPPLAKYLLSLSLSLSLSWPNNATTITATTVAAVDAIVVGHPGLLSHLLGNARKR